MYRKGCVSFLSVDLIKIALEAKEMAYAPYSNFKVGAALLTETGEVYTGCNIENSSYGNTVCAERVAFLKAVSEGKRQFKKIAVTAMPCGICRQLMAEFCSENFEIVVGDSPKNLKVYKLGDILPEAFILQKED